MSKSQIMFYATADDLTAVLSAAEAGEPLQYIRCGLFPVAVPQVYASYSDIPDFGRAIHPAAVANPRYLLHRQGGDIDVRRVPQKAGGILFAIDQLQNPNTIALCPGGAYGETAILSGMLGTASQSAESMRLYKFVIKAFKGRFSRHQEYLIGPSARALWHSGVRLTNAVSSPEIFDFKLNI